MNALEEHRVECPGCGESVTILIDCSVPYQVYTEDCFVCCQPMVICADCTDPDQVRITLQREDD